MTPAVTVVGAGLAGCEATWQLSRRGIPVRLREMKPDKKSPAHVSENFAELVCSNSLRSADPINAVGLLKEEMRQLDSLIIRCADANRVEAGSALAVDRKGFEISVTEAIRALPDVEIVPGEVTEIPEGIVIFATGPLTSEALTDKLLALLGGKADLHFYDAAAPIVTMESVDMDFAFFASRYGKGSADYVNCPMTKEEYEAFHRELASAKEAPVHGFEDSGVFEGCMPVEVMARRGVDTLRYGPHGPRHRAGALRRGAAAAGQLRGKPLQYRRLSDPSDLRGTETGLFHDPGPARRGIRALRGHAPQYLHRFSPASGRAVPAEGR